MMLFAINVAAKLTYLLSVLQSTMIRAKARARTTKARAKGKGEWNGKGNFKGG